MRNRYRGLRQWGFPFIMSFANVLSYCVTVLPDRELKKYFRACITSYC